MSEEKKWFVTAGVPGGEFAMRTDSLALIDKRMRELLEGNMGEVSHDRCIPGSIRIEGAVTYRLRPAPPELAEWLDAPNKCELGFTAYRLKVAGGWLYDQDEPGLRAFVPVALASGITVLDADDTT